MREEICAYLVDVVELAEVFLLLGAILNDTPLLLSPSASACSLFAVE